MPITSSIRHEVAEQCPDLLEETVGMAEGSGIPEERLFKHRFYGNVLARISMGCSTFFVKDDDGIAWLARTCDIEEEDHWNQTIQVYRPSNGPAVVTTSYLGFSGGVGINEHGLGIVGASASTRDSYGTTGVISSLLLHRCLFHCSSVAECDEVMLADPVMGKGQLWLAADGTGASILYQIAPGRHVAAIPRAADRSWQACTNFQPSSSIPSAPNPLVMYNSYSRYGFIVHQLNEREVKYDREGLQSVLKGISQPGPNIPKGSLPLETAYGTLFNLNDRTMYIAQGNPNTTPFEEVSFL